MSRKPLIGLNADYRPSRKEGPALSYVPAGYYNSIQAAGGIPVIIPPTECEADLARVLDLLQGFVLVGGGDLDPRRDGYQMHSSVRPMDPSSLNDSLATLRTTRAARTRPHNSWRRGHRVRHRTSTADRTRASAVSPRSVRSAFGNRAR